MNSTLTPEDFRAFIAGDDAELGSEKLALIAQESQKEGTEAWKWFRKFHGTTVSRSRPAKEAAETNRGNSRSYRAGLGVLFAVSIGIAGAFFAGMYLSHSQSVQLQKMADERVIAADRRVEKEEKRAQAEVLAAQKREEEISKQASEMKNSYVLVTRDLCCEVGIALRTSDHVFRFDDSPKSRLVLTNAPYALERALEDVEPNVRIGAAVLLGKLDKIPQSSTKALLVRISDEDQVVRVACAIALARHGDKSMETIDVLSRTMPPQGHFGLPTRLQHGALHALGEVGPTAKSAIPYLEAAIQQTENRYFSRDAIEALAKVKRRPALPQLFAAGEGGQGMLSMKFGGGESAYDNPGSAPPPTATVKDLIAILADSDPENREDALDELSKRQNSYQIRPDEHESIVESVFRIYADINENVRYAAAETMIAFDHQPVHFDLTVPLVVEALHKGTLERRVSLAGALPKLTQVLLRRPSPFPGEEIEITPAMEEKYKLQTRAIRTILDALREMCADPSKDAQYAAALAIRKIGDKGEEDEKVAKEILRSAVRNETGATQLLAILALDADDFGPDLASAVPALRRMLTPVQAWNVHGGFGPVVVENPDDLECDYRRGFSAVALGKIGLPARAAVEYLRSIMIDSKEKVGMRFFAAQAIVRITPDDVSGLDFLISGLSHEKDMVRAEVARTIGEMGKKGAKAIEALELMLEDPSEWVREAVTEALVRVKAK